MFVKTKPGTTQAVLKELEDMHTDISSLPFEFHFLDEDLEKSYRKEMITQKLAGIFSVLAIFISCLGLFGLASFAAQQRIKEIAIRKVLGARIPQVVNLLFKEYILIILLSFLVSIPVAYLWIDNWLGNFAFHINLNWWIFVIPGCLVFFIALLTIGRIAFRSAQTNPAISLRNE